MSEQLAFNLAYRIAYGREKFWVAPCNQEAITWIDRYPDWPMHALLIYGPSGSGKTHLATLFSDSIIQASDLKPNFKPQFQQKMVVENLQDLTDEEALFHLFNFVQEMGGDLLLTSQQIPQFRLPDLQSRLNMIAKAEIMMPDESVIRAVARKAFEDRHILVDDAVLDYLSTHLTRSFSLLQQVVERADKLSLEVRRKITISIIKQVIQELKGDNDV